MRLMGNGTAIVATPWATLECSPWIRGVSTYRSDRPTLPDKPRRGGWGTRAGHPRSRWMRRCMIGVGARHVVPLRYGPLVAGRAGQVIQKRAGPGAVGPQLHADVEVKNVGCGEASARAVDWEDRLPAHLVVVDVLHHCAAPVREIEEVDPGLVGVDRGFNRDAAHRLLPGEEQVEVVGAAAAAFLDHLADGDAQVLPGVLLFD